MARPRICFVAPNLYPVLARRTDIEVVGGAEVQQAFIARQLIENGFEVAVVSADFGQAEGEVVDGVRVHKTFKPDAGLPGLRAVHPRMTRVWQALTRADADIYYVRCAAMTVALVAAFCRTHGRKSVFAGASDLDFVPGHELIDAPWYRVMYRWGLQHADAVVAQNPEQVRLCRTNKDRDAVLIPSMFVPPAQALEALPGAAEVLWCGVLRESKRVEAFVELARRLPNLVFRVIGGPDSTVYSRSMAGQLRALAAELPNLRYDGFQPYEAADQRFLHARVFVNTSLHEGFPNTFLQAWSRGVPTLSIIDVGATQGGEPVGHVCADIDVMEKQLRLWSQDRSAWQAASDRARLHFNQRHSADAAMAAYLKLFGELASSGAARPASEASQASANARR
jgi:glycosyltransferase involved in cell wall biosynthesis